MKKKIMLMMLVVTVGMLSGCGKETETNSNSTQTEQEDTKQETQAEDASEESTDEKSKDGDTTKSGEPAEVDETNTESDAVEGSDAGKAAQDNANDGSAAPTDGTKNNDVNGNSGSETVTDVESTDGAESGSQENIYGVCTSIPAAEVEAFASQVKQQIINHDWKGLAANIYYPISVGGVTYETSDEFAAGNFEDSLSQSFVDAVEAETCTNMYCDWQGIMLGDGEVWISEVLSSDASSQGLKVTALNGMVE